MPLKSLAWPAPEECREPAGCAAFALAQHRRLTRTLVIANTVARAREIFRLVRVGFPGAILLHSRFRLDDRNRAADALLGIVPPEGQIVISTQVLEAGVDITSRLLITDIAPWGSLVQRFGRVNRGGDDADAEIWWIDQPAPSHAKQKNPTAPYNGDEIKRALDRIRNLTSGAPADLPEEDGPEPWTNVLRRADLLDLFDTTTDLSGNQLDVSRFIRATEDNDAYLAWRDWEREAGPPSSLNEIEDAELCPVSLGELREFMKKHAVYTWNFATEKWEEADKDKLYAGMMVVTRATEGGYTPTEGWSPESKIRVVPLLVEGKQIEGDSGDSNTFTYYRQTLFDHTNRVVEELEILLAKQALDEGHSSALRGRRGKARLGQGA